MGKFKVGDRVRYKNPVYGEATVVRVNPDGSVVVDTHCEFGICTEDPNELEPVAVAASNSNPEQHLTIQAGKFYKTRDGRKVGPARPRGDPYYPWWVGESTYTDSGAWVDGMEDDNDLISEWADEPPVAEQQAGSTAGFTVPLCAYEDEPGRYADELGRAYADGYAAGRRAALTQAA